MRGAVFFTFHFSLFTFVFLVFLAGCNGRPSKINNELRAKNLALAEQMDTLKRQHEQDQAQVATLRSERGTLATLPADRLSKLVTAASLSLGRLTGGDSLGPDNGYDRGLKVYVVPNDVKGDDIKSAGSCTVEAFDMADSAVPLVGTWKFDLQQTSDSWYSGGLLYTYVLSCPWQKIPGHAQLTIQVKFFDELTQTELPPVKKDVAVRLPTATQATTRP